MKKSLRNIVRTGFLVGSLAVNGCTGFGSALIQDSPVGAYWDAKEQIKQDVGNRNKQNYQETYQQPQRNYQQQEKQENYKKQEKMFFLEDKKIWIYKGPNGRFFPAKLEQDNFYYKNHKDCWTPVKEAIKIKISSQ